MADAKRNPAQVNGMIGWGVDALIRNASRRAFHTIWWQPPRYDIPQPWIVVPNHHGWHDGYVMYLALTALQVPFFDWIAEYHVFPLFGKVGGLPFPAASAHIRAATLRKTVRAMQQQRRSLLLFAEGTLHRPPELLPFGKSLAFVQRQVPEASLVPVAIRYQHAIHERPEAFIQFLDPVSTPTETHNSIATALSQPITSEDYRVLVRGRRDANETWQFGKRPV
ncbi:MAG: lysophospholipid acyltransferase family protein [Fimbriimonadaceae bacterium]|nr:lysophospholipid acyltransferase family protein [Fimbriimonadaceae bacterium]